MQIPERIEPQSVSEYLDVMSKSVFQSGLSWKVVKPKWPGTQEALHGFDVEAVAELTDDDLDRLVEDSRISAAAASWPRWYTTPGGCWSCPRSMAAFGTTCAPTTILKLR